MVSVTNGAKMSPLVEIGHVTTIALSLVNRGEGPGLVAMQLKRWGWCNNVLF